MSPSDLASRLDETPIHYDRDSHGLARGSELFAAQASACCIRAWRRQEPMNQDAEQVEGWIKQFQAMGLEPDLMERIAAALRRGASPTSIYLYLNPPKENVRSRVSRTDQPKRFTEQPKRFHEHEPLVFDSLGRFVVQWRAAAGAKRALGSPLTMWVLDLLRVIDELDISLPEVNDMKWRTALNDLTRSLADLYLDCHDSPHEEIVSEQTCRLHRRIVTFDGEMNMCDYLIQSGRQFVSRRLSLPGIGPEDAFSSGFESSRRRH